MSPKNDSLHAHNIPFELADLLIRSPSSFHVHSQQGEEGYGYGMLSRQEVSVRDMLYMLQSSNKDANTGAAGGRHQRTLSTQLRHRGDNFIAENQVTDLYQTPKPHP